MARLADPRLWELLRKLAEHPALFDQVSKLADAYPDPCVLPAKSASTQPAKAEVK
jgi:hypothetical protein